MGNTIVERQVIAQNQLQEEEILAQINANDAHQSSYSLEKIQRTPNSKIITVIVDDQIQFEVDITDPTGEKTCGWLLSEVTRKYTIMLMQQQKQDIQDARKQMNQNSTNQQDMRLPRHKRKYIVALKTKEFREGIDCWLNQYERNLSVLRDKTVLEAHFAKINPQPGTSLTQKRDISINDFESIRIIGRGGFSRVILARKKDTGRLYAIKIIRKDQLSNEHTIKPILTERQILEQLDHPFLIKLHWAFQNSRELFFVMDICTGGELFIHLMQHRRFSEKQVKFYFSEILLGFQYMHERDIVFRDIKPENILVDMDGHIRIADFGLSKIIEENAKSHSFCGSPEYLSPEMLQSMEGHDRRIDIYSLGVLLYEMLTGLPPFFDENHQKMFENIMTHEPLLDQPFMSENVKSLISNMLEKDPVMRFQSISEIMQQKWFRDIDWDKVRNKQMKPPIIPDINSCYFENVMEPDIGETTLNLSQLQPSMIHANISRQRQRQSYYIHTTMVLPSQMDERTSFIRSPSQMRRQILDQSGLTNMNESFMLQNLQTSVLEGGNVNLVNKSHLYAHLFQNQNGGANSDVSRIEESKLFSDNIDNIFADFDYQNPPLAEIHILRHLEQNINRKRKDQREKARQFKQLILQKRAKDALNQRMLKAEEEQKEAGNHLRSKSQFNKQEAQPLLLQQPRKSSQKVIRGQANKMPTLQEIMKETQQLKQMNSRRQLSKDKLLGYADLALKEETEGHVGGLDNDFASQVNQLRLSAVSRVVGDQEFSNDQTMGQNSQNFDESRILQRFIAEIPSDNVSDPSSFPVTPRSIRRDQDDVGQEDERQQLSRILNGTVLQMNRVPSESIKHSDSSSSLESVQTSKNSSVINNSAERINDCNHEKKAPSSEKLPGQSEENKDRDLLGAAVNKEVIVKKHSSKKLVGRDNQSHEDKISPDRNDENLFDCDEHQISSPKQHLNMNTYEGKHSELIKRLKSQQESGSSNLVVIPSPMINIEHIDVDDIDSRDDLNFQKNRAIKRKTKTDVVNQQLNDKEIRRLLQQNNSNKNLADYEKLKNQMSQMAELEEKNEENRLRYLNGNKKEKSSGNNLIDNCDAITFGIQPFGSAGSDSDNFSGKFMTGTGSSFHYGHSRKLSDSRKNQMQSNLPPVLEKLKRSPNKKKKSSQELTKFTTPLLIDEAGKISVDSNKQLKTNKSSSRKQSENKIKQGKLSKSSSKKKTTQTPKRQAMSILKQKRSADGSIGKIEKPPFSPRHPSIGSQFADTKQISFQVKTESQNYFISQQTSSGKSSRRPFQSHQDALKLLNQQSSEYHMGSDIQKKTTSNFLIHKQSMTSKKNHLVPYYSTKNMKKSTSMSILTYDESTDLIEHQVADEQNSKPSLLKVPLAHFIKPGDQSKQYFSQKRNTQQIIKTSSFQPNSSSLSPQRKNGFHPNLQGPFKRTPSQFIESVDRFSSPQRLSQLSPIKDQLKDLEIPKFDTGCSPHRNQKIMFTNKTTKQKVVTKAKQNPSSPIRLQPPTPQFQSNRTKTNIVAKPINKKANFASMHNDTNPTQLYLNKQGSSSQTFSNKMTSQSSERIIGLRKNLANNLKQKTSLRMLSPTARVEPGKVSPFGLKQNKSCKSLYQRKQSRPQPMMLMVDTKPKGLHQFTDSHGQDSSPKYVRDSSDRSQEKAALSMASTARVQSQKQKDNNQANQLNKLLSPNNNLCIQKVSTQNELNKKPQHDKISPLKKARMLHQKQDSTTNIGSRNTKSLNQQEISQHLAMPVTESSHDVSEKQESSIDEMLAYPKHYSSNQNPVKPPQNSDLYYNMADEFSKTSKVKRGNGGSILNQMGPIGPKFGRGSDSNRSQKVNPLQNSKTHKSQAPQISYFSSQNSPQKPPQKR